MSKIVKTSITLTSTHAQAIRAAIEKGDYDNQSEVIRAAMALWQQRQEARDVALDRLRTLWDEGIASGPARPLDMPSLRRRVRTRLAESQE